MASSLLTDEISDDEFKTLMKIRTITCFVHLTNNSTPPFNNDDDNNEESTTTTTNDETIARAAKFLKTAEQVFVTAGWTVQTLRIATNPFGEWLLETATAAATATTHNKFADATKAQAQQLQHLDTVLETHGIEFCALGPAVTRQEVKDICPLIVATSHRLSCSAALRANDVDMAQACASTIQSIALLLNNNGEQQHVQNGLGNFRFCVATNCSNKTSIPFFPVAATSRTRSGNDDNGDDSSPTTMTTTTTSGLVGFAIGLENGVLANRLLAQCGSIQLISTVFKSGMHRALLPIQAICKGIDEKNAATTITKSGHGDNDKVQFLGIDTSLNPSLVDANGSIATAIEQLQEVAVFGGPGTIAAAAAITTCLQSLPDEISCTGYCGLMLPVCEDQRLVQLVASSSVSSGSGRKKDGRCLQIADLLSISSVCGVGIDTVPIAGDFCQQELTSLLLDVAGLAERWDKSLSCRVLPMPGKKLGDETTFTSPYMMNTKVMSLI